MALDDIAPPGDLTQGPRIDVGRVVCHRRRGNSLVQDDSLLIGR